MNDADIIAGQWVELAPGVRRLTAPNPGMMTGPGTNTYVVGRSQLAVIDPGPAIDSHIDQISTLDDIRWILATHTHPDHSPGCARLAELTGATIVGRPAPQGPHQDQTFEPALVPVDDETLTGPDFELQMLQTPGHASNHLCFLHLEYRWLFTGDHVMAGSTVVIDPPDGDMRDYIDSLRRLRTLELEAIAPGHGPLLREPYDVIDWIVEHRLDREAKIRAAVAANEGLSSVELVPHVYQDVDKRLFGLAERSLLAHLIKLRKDGALDCQDNRWRIANA